MGTKLGIKKTEAAPPAAPSLPPDGAVEVGVNADVDVDVDDDDGDEADPVGAPLPVL